MSEPTMKGQIHFKHCHQSYNEILDTQCLNNAIILHPILTKSSKAIWSTDIKRQLNQKNIDLEHHI